MRGGAASKPALPLCHLCGQQFGTASIKIHQKTCKEKYERERGRAAPEAPMSPFLNGGDERQIKGMTAQAIEEFNDSAYQAWAGDLEPCPNCGRRFLPDRLAVHARACSSLLQICVTNMQ